MEEPRSQPRDYEAEQAALGCALISRDAADALVAELEPGMFYDSRHALIAESIVALRKRSTEVDYVTICDWLSDEGHDEHVTPEYVTGLSQAVPSAATYNSYFKIVKDKYECRRAIEIAESHVGELYRGQVDTVEAFQRDLLQLRTNGKHNRFESWAEIMVKAGEYLDNVRNNGGNITGLPTGIRKLDNMTAGFQKQGLIIIAGRPSQGKTAFAVNNFVKVNALRGVPGAIFSLEMSNVELVLRLLASAAQVDYSSARIGKLNAVGWSELTVQISKISELPIWINDAAALPITSIQAQARRLKNEHDIQYLVVDYIQLGESGKKTETRNLDVTEISRGLKAIAKELDIPVIAVSQLSRAVETRGGDRRPILSDLRDSGAIEQDADVVMFLYRPEYYFPNEESYRNKAEAIIGKQRNGPTGTVDMFFHKEWMTFSELEVHQEVKEEVEEDLPF